MHENPDLDLGRIAACLETQYGRSVASVTFLPFGYDSNAAVYNVITCDGSPYFLKIRFGRVHEPALLVPRALIDGGVRNVLAPLRTRTSSLWCTFDGHTVVLYPYITGQSAMAAGMSDHQWREFGSTLRAIHSSGLAERFRGQLRTETFALPSAALVRQLLNLIDSREFERPAARRLAAFWRENGGRIRNLLARAEELGSQLRSRSFAYVLCHADIHAANTLVGGDGRIHLIDWDEPLLAPRERDLLFVVGSRIARAVKPREENLFFEGYGSVEIDPTALAYCRYERIVEDIGEVGKSVFLNPRLGEQARTEEAELAMRFFAVGGGIDCAESINGEWLGT